MSVHAGTIVTVAGKSLVERIQSAGLGDVRIPIDTIREVGNELVVDKVVQEPDFTFTLEALDVSIEIEAILQGKVASGTGSAQVAGYADPDGTEYAWENCQAINIASPWKDHATGSAGVVAAGHLVPGYYPTRIRYQAGITDNFSTTVELGGGSFYYGKFAPKEDTYTGNGATAAFVTTDPAVEYRKGGADGTTFKSVFGVLVDGVLMVEGEDYTTTGGGASPGSAVTVTFVAARIPANGKTVRIAYFTSAAKAYPQPVHSSTIVKPGAVRGRNICVSIASAGASTFEQVASVQSFSLEATVDSVVEREFCNEEPVGRTINGIDCSGDMTVRAKDYIAFFAILRKITGVNTDSEVVGFINQNPVQLKLEIQNPKDTGTTIKTLYVEDALFDIPGTPARVNQPTDFAMGWQSRSGTYSAFKGEMP
jgi:hypothetical protein